MPQKTGNPLQRATERVTTERVTMERVTTEGHRDPGGMGSVLLPHGEMGKQGWDYPTSHVMALSWMGSGLCLPSKPQDKGALLQKDPPAQEPGFGDHLQELFYPPMATKGKDAASPHCCTGEKATLHHSPSLKGWM